MCTLYNSMYIHGTCVHVHMTHIHIIHTYLYIYFCDPEAQHRTQNRAPDPCRVLMFWHKKSRQYTAAPPNNASDADHTELAPVHPQTIDAICNESDAKSNGSHQACRNCNFAYQSSPIILPSFFKDPPYLYKRYTIRQCRPTWSTERKKAGEQHLCQNH